MRSAARDRRHQGDSDARVEHRVEALKEPHVLVGDEHVDEST